MPRHSLKTGEFHDWSRASLCTQLVLRIAIRITKLNPEPLGGLQLQKMITIDDRENPPVEPVQFIVHPSQRRGETICPLG